MPSNVARIKNHGLNGILDILAEAGSIQRGKSIPMTVLAHYHVTREIEPDHSAEKIRGFELDQDKIIKLFAEGGNCIEKSYYLSALLHKIPGVEARILHINKIPAGHTLVETRFPGMNAEEVVDELTHFYKTKLAMKTDSYVYSTDDDGKPWFIADPGLSRYIGDTESLVEKDWAVDDPENGFTWNHPVEIKSVD